MTTEIILTDRSIIEIAGADRKKFLQGLITNDINKVSDKSLLYSTMLNSQGRFLYDFFLFEKDEKIFLDCLNTRCDEIIKKLSLYKLRSQVTIKKNDELKVSWNLTNGQFKDPRTPTLGHRTYSSLLTPNSSPLTSYHSNRISLKIPESEYDLTYEKSFILEFGFDDLNAVDYNKGCYVGQELTARTHYKGEIRKKIFHIELEKNSLEWQNFTSLKNGEITCEGKSLGLILSSVVQESKIHALALIRIPLEKDMEKDLEFLGQKIVIIN